VIDNVHSTMTRPSRFYFLRCVMCHKQTDDGRLVDITCIPTTSCGDRPMQLCVIASFRLTISDRCSVDTDGRIGPASGTETVWEFEFSVNSDVTVM